MVYTLFIDLLTIMSFTLLLTAKKNKNRDDKKNEKESTPAEKKSLSGTV